MPVRGIRRRYLRFRVDTQLELSDDEVYNAIRNSIKELYGLKGLSKADPSLIEYDTKNMMGILRCSNDELRSTRAAIAYITNIKGAESAVHINRVSGTIKSLKRKEVSNKKESGFA
jgi:RNase P/RNase MRP subunit POP5